MPITRETPLAYRGYTIEPKRDFGHGPGFLINGKYVMEGWIVVKDGCNALPGAIWCGSIPQAVLCIDVLVESEETGADFWRLFGEKSEKEVA